MNLGMLHEQIHKVTPIIGVSVGEEKDRATWKVQYAFPPSADILSQVQNIIEEFDINKKPMDILKESIRLSLKGAVLTEQKDIDLRAELLAIFETKGVE